MMVDTTLQTSAPPQSHEAEVAVLGSMLADKESMLKGMDLLRDDDFYEETHRQIFLAIRELHDKNVTPDAVTVGEHLQKMERLADVGGQTYLFHLTNMVPSALHVEHYAKIVREKSTLRQMMRLARMVSSDCLTQQDEAGELLDKAQQAFFGLAQEKATRGMVSASQLMQSAIGALEKLAESNKFITGVPTGFKEFDKLTSGLQPSNLVIVAGRPSMGKTSWCLNVAEHVAIKEKRSVVFFSLEMSEQEIGLRLLCSQARINLRSVREGFLARKSWPTITNVASQIASAPLFFDFSTSPTVLDIRSSSRRWAHELKHKGTPLSLIVIDYMQLMRGSGHVESRQQEISEISRSLKGLARELQVPVIALSQLNRRPEEKGREGRPQLSDLRECVVGSTLVILADGRREPISSLVGQAPHVLAMTPNGKIRPALSDKVWRVGVRPVLEIRLASGRSITVTPDHRLYGFDGWRRASQLRSGDRLALSRVLPEPLVTERWPSRRLALLGQLIGDGSYLKGQPLRYTTSSEENSAAVTEAAREEFGCTVKRYAGRRNWHQLLIGGNGNRWHPAGVNKWLRDLGVFGQRSHEKRIPSSVFRLGNDQLACLLRHLWATDGTVTPRMKGRGSHAVSYCTNSRGLADDVAALLLRLGIVARLYHVKQGKYRPVTQVTVSGAADQKRFLATVGAFGPRQEPAKRLAILLKAMKVNTNVDTLPQGVFERVKRAMRRRGISHREMAALRGTSYGGSAHFCFSPSRTVMVEYANLLDDASLALLAKDDLFWDAVTAVVPKGEAEVFDLTVPTYSSWLADGIVCHNSGAIEQDADLVAAIFREEVYKRDDPELKGKAKLFVLKQRNGPIGDIDMNFLDEFTRFCDPAPEEEPF